MGARTELRHDGELVACAGATRSGKTAGAKQACAGEHRLLVWDPRGEWRGVPGVTMIETPRGLAQHLVRNLRKSARVAYFGRAEDFNAFCRAAYLWVQAWPAVIVVDEVADHTSAGKAAGAFGELIRKGLYYGAHVWVLTQRPQETSTSLWGNANRIRCYEQRRDGDREYMARQMAVPIAELEALRAPQYLERAVGADDWTRGELRF